MVPYECSVFHSHPLYIRDDTRNNALARFLFRTSCYAPYIWRLGMTIKLDWRFGLLERLGDVHMKGLIDFYRQAEEHFRVAMEAWEAETTGLTEEQEAKNSDYLIERRDSIESL